MSGSFIRRRNAEGAPGQRRRGQVPHAAVAERKAAGEQRAHLCEKSQCGPLRGAGGRLVFSFALCCTPSPPSSRLADSHN